MNTQKVSAIATVLITGALLLVPPAIAQSQNLIVTIPFDFYVASKLLPAGKYTVEPRSQAAALRIHGPNGESAFVLTTALAKNARPDESRLAFRQYGDMSFLVGVYWEGYANGRETVTSAMEQRLARSTGPAPIVVIAGNK